VFDKCVDDAIPRARRWELVAVAVELDQLRAGDRAGSSVSFSESEEGP
jgi:hypothetical protein